MEYVLTINRKSADGGGVIKARAEGIVADGAVDLTYEYDGARYFLKAVKGRLVHGRRGDVCTDMEFRQGCVTEFIISHGGMYGSYEIYTHRLSVVFDGNGGCSIICKFGDTYNGDTEMSIAARLKQ